MKIIKLLTALACIVLSVSTAIAGEKTGSLLWKISGKDLSQPSYLLGTLHVASGEMLDSIAGANEAFAACEQVIGELIMSDMITQAGRIQEAGMMPSDTTYQMLYDEEEYRIVNDGITKLLGAGLDKVGILKPVMLHSMVSMMIAKKRFPDSNPETILDNAIQKKALQEGKDLTGLESLDDQINALFKGTSLTRQAGNLLCVFEHIDESWETMEMLVKAYREGDLLTLENLIYGNDNTCPLSQREIDVLLNHRNDRWVEQLPGLMAQKPCFVAVGAGHLPGESGLLTQLEKLGYTVEAVK